MPQVQPLGDRVAAEPLDGSSTPSGLVVAAFATDPPPIARIVAAGPEVTGLQVGDVIAYNPKAGVVELNFPGEAPMLVVETKAVIAKIGDYGTAPTQPVEDRAAAG